MKVQVCTGKACSEKFSSYIITRIENDKEKFDLADVEICSSPCMGGCSKGPNIKINGDKIGKCTPAKASELLFKKLQEQGN